MLACGDCGTALDPSMLACPACRKLTRSEQLAALANQARDASRRGDFAAERAVWEQCAANLPSDTVQYRSIQARIGELDARIAPAPSGAPALKSGRWGKSTAGAGSILLLLLGKGKVLLLGLTKLSTLLSMLA
jgi:hypothetical protein